MWIALILIVYMVLAGIICVAITGHAVYLVVSQPGLYTIALGKILMVSLFWPVILIVFIKESKE